jgi:transposase-like protein
MKIIGNVIYSEDRRVDVQKHQICLACTLNEAAHYHHILPFVDGGRTLIPVCENCHNKIHGLNFQKHSENVKKGLQKAKENGKRLGQPKKFIDVIPYVDLYHQGLSYRQIAKKLNCSVGTVCRILKENLPNSVKKKNETKS